MSEFSRDALESSTSPKGSLIDSKDLFALFMDHLPGGLAFIKNQEGHVLYNNKRLNDLFGGVDWNGKTVFDVLPYDTAEAMTADDKRALAEGMLVTLDSITDSDGRKHIFVTYKFPITRQDAPTLLGGISIDVTDRREAEEQIQRQLDHLTSLHTIDLAITTRADLDVTLEIFLEQVLEQLEVNAAVVMTYNPNQDRLVYGGSKGFRSSLVRKANLLPGQGIAGRVFQEQHMVGSPYALDDPDLRYPWLAEEGFVAYYAIPLLAKDEVKGTLEVYHRQVLKPKPDWFDFLQSLASQGAIAIDNANLYKNLQETNASLIEAYDRTIEGWARALEMRDQETEGHSQRLVNLTERMARTMGMPERDLVCIRQGALLHDIGKMAIPDSILLKPGPLTTEEWDMMKMHPIYARLMLKKIDFLLPAIDIPYCHHEKWDGSGYPRGLKGEEIPLSARIFAIADVYDALRFDRPYRKGLTNDTVLKYIEEQAGIHFDPQLVKIFLDLVQKYPDL
jgi:putative nucleotidyltransferase with HDIG domain/PAS domain S-box-containing protein